MNPIDITSLQETAIRIQKDLKTLPYAVMRFRLGLLGISLLPNVQNKDVSTNFLRKAGIAKPYVGDGTVNYSDVGKAEEVILEVQKAYASVKDTIQNYKKTIVGPDVLLGKNKSKKHPWQQVMLSSIAKTFGEDILFVGLFHGVRDILDQSPTGLFDGYHKKIDDAVVGGAIAAGEGNYNTSVGAISAPSDEADTAAADQLLDLWRSTSPFFQEQDSIMIINPNIGHFYDDAHFNKFRYKPTKDEWGRTFLHGTNDKCRLVRSNEIGTGQRIILTLPGNAELGIDTFSDQEFIQVRDIFEDPNFLQFWLQADYGTRYLSFHKKVFLINDQSAGNANNLSGDYIS